MAARRYRPPREWLAPAEEWPAGRLIDDAPPYAVVTAAIVARYQEVVGDRSLRSVARQAGVDATSLGRMLAGETVPDVHTLAVLEDAVATDLWPTRRDRRRPSR